MKSRLVKITIVVIGQSDRDPWEWGDAIARSLKDDFDREESTPFGPVTVNCDDAEYVK